MLERFQTEEKGQIDKDALKAENSAYKDKLAVLGQKIKEAKLPVIIAFEGWGASGKGYVIGKTIGCLDPRSYLVHSTVGATVEEKRLPLMSRFWKIIPEKGKLCIFDRSWYQEIVPAAIEQDLSEEELVCRLDKANLFERQLADDGYLIIKFFLHISQEEQKHRFKKLLENEDTSWRVTDIDLKRNRKYDKYFVQYDKMLEYTNTVWAPWTVVDAENKTETVNTVFKTIASAIEARLEGRKAEFGEGNKRIAKKEGFTIAAKPPLDMISLDKALSEEVYREELKKQQKRLAKLHSRLYMHKIPVVMAFEGWDAAGKGGTIRRIASALDPRGFEAVPISAPQPYELNRHYLWRFWQELPKSGHITIFDRTWYGRVLVERVEGLTPEKRWREAYQEINEFENQLYDEGVLVLKFWLQIDRDEQLKRFNDRMNTPEKRWKITDEDWRNREKWDAYTEAVNEMLQKTSTDFAPWHVIENNDKRFGRIRTLNVINNAIEAWIERHKL
mgnify:CR=1 FL=1